MPVLKNVILVAVLCAAAAGCGSGSSAAPVAAAPSTSGSATTPTDSATASTTPSGKDSGVAWAKCMRAHGVEVADPAPQGNGVRLLLPQGADHTKVDAATKVCQKYLPGGGALIKPNPADLARLRKLSQCMRENGEPKFPDPTADGGIRLDSASGIDPQDPAFLKAQNACAKYSPQGGKTGVLQSGK